MAYKGMVGLRENQEIYRDKRGRVIRTGDIVTYGKRKGIIREEDREGQYIEMKDGFKLRLSAFYKKMTVVASTGGNR